MSTGVHKASRGNLDIKRHEPSILYISASLVMSTSILKALLVNLISKGIPFVFSMYCTHNSFRLFCNAQAHCTLSQSLTMHSAL